MPNTKQNLSKWVRPLVKTFVDFEQGIKSITDWITPLQNGIITPTEPSVLENAILAVPAGVLEKEKVLVVPELAPETSVLSPEVALLQALAAQAAATAAATATLHQAAKEESPRPSLLPVDTPPLLPMEVPRMSSQTSVTPLPDTMGPSSEIQQHLSEQEWDIHSDDSMAAELDGAIDEDSPHRQSPLLPKCGQF
ncbi:unnamed protein product [Mortierella alpina]